MRRLALLVPLLAVVAVTGTASGSLDRTPRDVVEQALMKVKPAPDYSGVTRNAGNRVRVIVTLDDPPLAAATFARRLPGLGGDVKLNLSTAFSRSYLGTPRGGAGEGDREHPPGDSRGERLAGATRCSSTGSP